MARLPRLTLPGYPHHIILRGNNRQTIFSADADRQFFLDLLGENARRFEVALHAYVLMDNHVHVLATPQSTTGIPQLMQSLGRSYVRYFNAMHRRSGTLWEGRYRSTLIQAERHLIACMVYIDLNPVRAGMVSNPRQFPWSSHRHYVGQQVDPLISPHALFWSMGNTPFAREQAYEELVHAGVSDNQRSSLTDATLQGWALGDASYVADLQAQTDRRLAKQSPGRPKKPLRAG